MWTPRPSVCAASMTRREQRVRAGVGCVRAEHRHQAPVALAIPLLRPRDGLLEPLLRIRQKAQQHAGDHAADAAVEHRPRPLGIGVIHIIEAGHAPADHLHDPEQRSPVDVLRLQLRFQRPDALLQPGHELHVVRIPPQQRHCRVRVRVHQPRDEHHTVGLEGALRGHLGRPRLAPPHPRDLGVANQHVPAGSTVSCASAVTTVACSISHVPKLVTPDSWGQLLLHRDRHDPHGRRVGQLHRRRVPLHLEGEVVQVGRAAPIITVEGA